MIDDTIGNAMTMRPGNEGGKLGRIDQYELVRELGGGGFGTVFLAKDTVSGIEVAVKGLPPLVRNNREELENVRSNFALVAKLHHPNIAAALVLHPATEVSYASEDVRQKLRVLSGDFLMVMEYAPGVTLSQWRRQFPGNKVPLAQALGIVRQIASAIDYAHERRIVHRDIKPANVMMETTADDKTVARVLDFGLAAEIRSSMGRMSREIRDTSGTRPYMAPEQWLGGKQGPATDQYALAVLFHELITGEVPFSAVFDTGDPVVMMNVVGREPFAPPSVLAKPVRLALGKALAKKPEERFTSCGDFVAALEGKAKVSRRGAESLRRGRLGKALGFLAFLIALGAVGYYGWTKYDAHVKAQKAEAARFRQQVYELKGKASQAREKNAKEEWHDWPHFSQRAKELEGAFRAGESAFEKDDYEVAKMQFLNVRDDWYWLSSNKVERIKAIAAKEKAEEGRRNAEAAKAAELSADGFAEATNTFVAALKSFDSGDFTKTKTIFERAIPLFERVTSSANAIRLAAERAERDAKWKKSEESLARKEAEFALRIADLRKDVNVALSSNDDSAALAKATELVNMSLDADDAKSWVDVYLRLADKKSNPLVRRQTTDDLREILDNGQVWEVDVEMMRSADLEDPAVLNIFGMFFLSDNYGFKPNHAVAREFFSRALAGGFKDAEKNFKNCDETVRLKPYFDAASSGDIVKIRHVFAKANLYVDIVDSKGMTPMFAAAANGDAEILDYMDELGFRFDVQNENGEVPFFSACANTNATKALSAVKWFVEKKGFDCNWRNTSTNAYATVNGLFKVKRLDVFEYLISKGAKLNLRDNRGRTLLHGYISDGKDAALVEAAIKAGVDLSIADDTGELPIHSAAHGIGDDSDKVIALLLRHGVDVNARMGRGKEHYYESYTPLHVACASYCSDSKICNRVKAIRALLANGANINAVSTAGLWNGYTPLQMAAENCYPDVIEAILGGGADVNSRVSSGFRQGAMPIHIAASHAENTNCIRALEILLAHGAKINSTVIGNEYYDGQTPLHFAIGGFYSEPQSCHAKPFLATISFLLESGADVNKEAKKEKYRINTPLGVACEKANVKLVSFLLKHGARKSLDTVSTDGRNLLHVMSGKSPNSYDKQEILDANEKTIAILAKAGMDVDGRIIGDDVYKGYTALHFAASKRNLCSIRALTMNGANVNAQDEYLNTPLMILAMSTSEEGLEECISYLLMCGANPDLSNKYGNTPLGEVKTSVARRLLSTTWRRNENAVRESTRAALEAFRIYGFDDKNVLSAGYRIAQNADQSDPNIQLYLAGCYAEGLPPPIDAVRTIAWYRSKADNGDADAQFLLATLLGNGKGMPRDEKLAKSFVGQAAKNGNAAAQTMYGILMCEEEHKYEDGVRWLRKSADSGVDLAELLLVKSSLEGKYGIQKDMAEIRQLLLKLSSKGMLKGMQMRN